VRLRLALLAALAAAALPACSRDLGPEATYRTLVRAVAERDADAAWALLAPDSQAWLAERARRAAAAGPGVVTPDPRALLLGHASLGARPPASIEVVRPGADRAVLRVEAPDAPAVEVTLVRDGGRWRVELPRSGAAGGGSPAPRAGPG
jgi:hypothetical protein